METQIQKGIVYPFLIRAGLLIGLLSFGSVNACELEETRFGYRGVGDCLLNGPIKLLKMPNLVPIDASANGTQAIDIEVTWKNIGQAATEGLLSFQFKGLDGNTYGPTGEFNVLTRVTVVDLLGNTITVADDNGNLDTTHMFLYRSQRMTDGASIRDYVGTVYLPDNRKNYDICMEVWVDSNPAVPSGSGEVQESNETDNYGRMSERIFPGIDPDPDDMMTYEEPNHEPSSCFNG